MSHGVRRIRQTPEALESKRQKEQSKLKEYLALTEDVLNRYKSRQWSRDALDLTTRLLTLNPELYTVWNYRRDICMNGLFPILSPAEVNEILISDLSLTTSFLRENPKIYWIWNHRRWCLENTPGGPEGDPQGWIQAKWTKELLTVEKMLDVDARNFHAWNYRRYILSSMPIKKPVTDEFRYTTKKIESSFSNFSAWHQRSKVLTTLWDKGELDVRHSKDEEFEFVKQAMYVDPNDQSAWIYHRWLIGEGNDRAILEREITVIEELLSLEPDSKWCLESLLYYKKLLLQIYGRTMDSGAYERILQDCQLKASKLETVDPPRKMRYRELNDTLRNMHLSA